MSTMHTKAASRSFAAKERAGTGTSNGNMAAEERARGYNGDRIYEGREHFARSRGVNGNRTLVNSGRLAETRSNRIYMSAENPSARYDRYGRTWSNGYVGIGTGYVYSGYGSGYPGYGYSGYGIGWPGYSYGYGIGYPGYGYSSYGFGYPGYGFGYGIGVTGGGLYAYAPGYNASSAGLYNYAPGYSPRVSRVGYTRGCSCSQ
jgi:hypothetical protein